MSNLIERMGVLRRYHRRRHGDYHRTFEGRQGQRVLADLWMFCQPVADPNPFVMAQSVGRHEVWQHIQKILGYDESRIEEVVELERSQREQEAS